MVDRLLLPFTAMPSETSTADVSAAGCAPRPAGHTVAAGASSTKYPSHETSELVGHDGGVMSVRFTATGAYALTAGRDKTVKLWNPYTGLCVKTYKGHGREVHDAAGSHDNSRVVSVDE